MAPNSNGLRFRAQYRDIQRASKSLAACHHDLKLQTGQFTEIFKH